MDTEQSIVVAIGPPLSGKSTFCHALTGRFRVESFAEPLYNMLGIVAGKSVVRSLRRANEKGEPCEGLCGKSLREGLQTLGTEWGRELMGEDIWLNHLMGRIKDYPQIAIDDMRFPNEYEGLKKAGAVFVRLLPLKDARKEGWEGHKSESFWRTFKVHQEFQWNERVEIMNAAQRFNYKKFRGKEPTL